MSSKKFAIGLSPLNYYNNDINAFDKFCKENDYRIEHWYSALPCTWKSKGIKFKSLREQKRNLKKQLTVIKNNNQKLQLAINVDIPSPFLRLVFYIQIIIYKLFYEPYKKVDSIVTRDEYISFLRKLFPDAALTYSIQNDFAKTKLKNLKYCDTIVIGRRYIKNLNFIRKIKEEYHIKIELLLNCACNFACIYHCFDGSCELSQKQQIDVNGIDKCVAWQSLVPSELKLYPEGLIDIYKLSTRPSSLEWMNLEMDLYSSEKSLSELNFNFYKPDFWKLVCCTNSISQEVEKKIPNVDTVLKLKSQIWSKLLHKKVDVY